MDALERFRQPAWTTAIATAISYGLILVAFALLLFGVPYLIFSVL